MPRINKFNKTNRRNNYKNLQVDKLLDNNDFIEEEISFPAIRGTYPQEEATLRPDNKALKYDAIENNELQENNSVKNSNRLYQGLVLGNRVVDIEYLSNKILDLQDEHLDKCPYRREFILKSSVTSGLVTRLHYRCNVCDFEGTVVSHDAEVEPFENKKVRIVWATLAVGKTYRSTNDFLSILNIPMPSYDEFHAIEVMLMRKLKKLLNEEIQKAGNEEREIAIARNDVDIDGVPFTTVYGDGGWSKRSYGHSYNANSGVAVIIGKYTNKILYLDVKNKYCSSCINEAKAGITEKQHECYKNWDQSSGAMEPAILVEGFKKSISMHNLKYKKFIGDGDSSVYSKIRNAVPYIVEKLECKNHIVKNVGKALLNIKKDKNILISAKKLLTMKVIKKIQSVAMAMINFNMMASVAELKDDFSNIIKHCYGHHLQCKEYYCEFVGDTKDSTLQRVLESNLYVHINFVIDTKLQRNANGLISNENNNPAEKYMSISCKFNAGKRLCLIKRGSYQTRCYIAALNYNMGPDWQVKAWNKIMGSESGPIFKKCFYKYVREKEIMLKRKADSPEESTRVKAKKTKIVNNIEKDYGPHATQALLTEEEYKDEETKLLQKLKVNVQRIEEIEKSTVNQFENIGDTVYLDEKKYRLTASNFGAICIRRETTNCIKLVEELIKPKSFKNRYMSYGTSHEDIAREEFKRMYPQMSVRKSGLVIDIDNNHLGASPDGFVGDNALMEIKCLLTVAESNLTLWEATEQNYNLPVEIVKGQLRIKRSHKFYYQIQGQLNICKREYCYFVIYTGPQNVLYVEKIKRDEGFWNIMKNKINKFYFDCYLPRLVDSKRLCFNEMHHKK